MSTFKYETNLLDAKETEENTIKAWKIKIEPKIKNWRLIDNVSEKRKLGKYAIKKSKTFGLTKFIYKPLKNKLVLLGLEAWLNLVFNSSNAR